MMTVQQAFELAVRHHLEGRLAEAAALYRQILAVQPRQVEALHFLGVLMHQSGQRDQALALIQQALTLAPQYAVAHMNFGNVLKADARLDEAIASYQQAIQLQPDLAEAYSNLGDTLRAVGKLEEAAAACRRALDINPNIADAWNNLAATMAAQGSLGEAEAAYRKSLQLQPYQPAVQSSLIYTLLLRPRSTDASLEEEQARWNERFGGPAKQFRRPHTNDRDPDRRLRVGYVSPDFRDHVVARNLLPLFRNHNRSRVEIVCFSEATRPDQVTEEFRRVADSWWSTVGMDDDALGQLISREQIDILVDLAQHTLGNRLLLFARQPVPVQVSFAGYPGGTGVEGIRYRISDRSLEEGNAEWRMTNGEKLPVSSRGERVFLLDSFWCYDARGVEVVVNALPARENGNVTFGSLNNFCKVNEPLLRLWARVLGAVKDARLVLFSPSGSHRQRTLNFLEREGVSPQRVEFVEPRPRQAYLELYHQLDVVLDTFPYNGHTTSLDALWMGVPVVSLAGRTAVSRAGLSQLNNLGLPELVAHSEDEYMEIATRLAGDLDRLAELRANLRPRMEASVLMDGIRFTRQIEEAYRAMWREWCAESPAP